MNTAPLGERSVFVPLIKKSRYVFFFSFYKIYRTNGGIRNQNLRVSIDYSPIDTLKFVFLIPQFPTDTLKF